MMSPGHSLINSHLRHIAQIHKHGTIYVILPFKTQASRWQVAKKIWIPSKMNSYSPFNLQLKPTQKILMRKWIIPQKASQQWSHQWWIRLKFRNTNQLRRIHQRLRILPMWSQLTIILHHWKLKIIWKLVARVLSNMISAHQNSMNSSSRNKSKATLLM